MEWITRSGLKIGTFPALRALAPGLDVFIATRTGGVSLAPFDSLNLGGNLGDRHENIKRNRTLILEAANIPRRKLALAGQVHGAKIAVARAGGLYQGFDGLITERSGLALAISTADCYSVVIYSPPEHAVAALHVGRKGAEREIIPRAAAMLQQQFRCDPAYAIAVIGPGICAECYTVSKADASPFPLTAKRFRHGAWHLDLEAFSRAELARCGLKRKNILSSGLCSSCNRELFFSHRRDRGITGRLWTLAVIRPNDELAVQRCD
jgi:YfiH family protein